MQAAIEARAVSHRTRAGEVTVRDVSLTVGHGELVAIIGGSGSGKTTLLDAMSGLRPPTSGTVSRDAASRDALAGGRRAAAPRALRQTGYVPQGATMHPVLPLARALRYTAALRGIRLDRAGGSGDGIADEALRAVGLAARAPVPVGALNPGERKRAAIAAELMARPAQLFLDEPTAGLDMAQAAGVLRLLRQLCDGGITVVFTTTSPLDAAQCDKVAFLATGGHLAFFGTPAAARGYFGADSLEEIYERLAGLADPAAAWSRRFFQFSRARAGFAPPPLAPPVPGPAVLLPDAAGPHSAGRPERTMSGGDPVGAGLDPDPDEFRTRTSAAEGAAVAGLVPAARNGQAEEVVAAAPPADLGAGGRLRSVGQLVILIRRNVDVVSRSVVAALLLAGAPVAVLLAFAVLIGAGAFDTGPSNAAGLAWIVLGGYCVGLAYGLPQVRAELGILRAERFAGLSAVAYVLGKLAIVVPALAAADAVMLAVPAAGGRLPYGYGPSCLTLLLSSAAALALALSLSAAAPALAERTRPLAALGAPVLLFGGAVGTLLDRPGWPDWTVLAVIAAALAAAATVLVARRAPAAPPPADSD